MNISRTNMRDSELCTLNENFFFGPKLNQKFQRLCNPLFCVLFSHVCNYKRLRRSVSCLRPSLRWRSSKEESYRTVQERTETFRNKFANCQNKRSLILEMFGLGERQIECNGTGKVFNEHKTKLNTSVQAKSLINAKLKFVLFKMN